MKQTMKRLVTFCLAVAMMLSLFPAMTAKAATKTENLTLYVGEAIYVTNYYDVTKVTTSNKKVLAVAKDKDNKSHANLTAKKAGTSTVRRHIEGGANRTLISAETPPRSCRIGTCRRLSAG